MDVNETPLTFDMHRGGHAFGPINDLSSHCALCGIGVTAAALTGVGEIPDCPAAHLVKRIVDLEKKVTELAAKDHLAKVIRDLKVDVIKVIEAGPLATVVFLLSDVANPAEISPAILETLKKALGVRNVFFATDVNDIKVIDQPLIQAPGLVMTPGRR